MEFKDRLKAMRKERAVSQQALADAIYVSRSAVAKWENGLGVPNRVSYEALLSFFGVTEEAFPLNEEAEQIIVEKNRKNRSLIYGILFLACILIAILSFFLLYAIQHGFGFTPQMAAGEFWQDNPYIETPEYVFFYGTFGDEEDTIQIIDRLCAVKKTPFGYQKLSLDDAKTAYTEKTERGWEEGTLYTFKGKTCYYYFFQQTLYAYQDEGVRLRLISEIRVKEDVIPLLYNSYFTYPFELTEFYIGDELCTVR